MDFSSFLKVLRVHFKVDTAKELFTKLGGQRKLGITLRHFQQIDSGKRPPSLSVFNEIFSLVSVSERKQLLLSYFRTVFNKTDTTIIDYLEKHLLQGFDSINNFSWNPSSGFMNYSDEQLSYLLENEDALRFHKFLLLYEKVPLHEVRIPEKRIRELIDLHLIKFNSGFIEPSKVVYRIPNFENSSPRSAAIGIDYMLKQVNTFVSRTSVSDQEVCYSMQMVSADMVPVIAEQFRSFKKWLQSHAKFDGEPSNVPLFFWGVIRRLEQSLTNYP